MSAPPSDPVVAPMAAPADGHPNPIARPSERPGAPRPLRLAVFGPLGWVLVSAAIAAYALVAVVGRGSVLGLLVAAGAVAGSTPLFARIADRYRGVEMAGVLRAALGIKLLATLPRFIARQDSVDYYRVGRELASSFRRLDFVVDTGREIPGTGTVRYVTGLVEVVTLRDEFATFVVFSLLGFLGLLAFVAAFRVALPHVDGVRYAVLVLFWPSLLYWPSSIGKEALMMLTLGVTAYGAARLLRGTARGVPWWWPDWSARPWFDRMWPSSP